MARAILGCLDSAPSIGADRVTDAMIGSLQSVTSYPDAIAVTEELERRSFEWKPERLGQLRAAMKNSQVSTSVVAGPRVAGWLRDNEPLAGPPPLGPDDDVPF